MNNPEIETSNAFNALLDTQHFSKTERQEKGQVSTMSTQKASEGLIQYYSFGDRALQSTIQMNLKVIDASPME